MNINTYTADDIHKMRLIVAGQYGKMSPDEVEKDFMAHVESAKRTMEILRKEKLAAAPFHGSVSTEPPATR